MTIKYSYQKSILNLSQCLLFACNLVSSLDCMAEATADIKPDFTYRFAGLKRNTQSAYHKEEHKDFVDQIYLTLKMTKTLDYDHKVVLEPTIRSKRNNPDALDLDDLHMIDQAYLESAISSHFTITAGKKTEYRGSGLFMNPSDLLNEDKDLYDPLYQREGKFMTRLSLDFASWNLGLGFLPRRAGLLSQGRPWLYLQGNVFDFDVVLQQTFHYRDKSTTGYSLARFFGEHIELHVDGRFQSRQRSETDLPERAGSDQLSYKKNDASSQIVSGSRFVFTPKRSLTVEYIWNQSGLLNHEYTDIYLPTVRVGDQVADPLSHPVKRRYAFASFFDEETVSSLRLGVSSLYGLGDSSCFVSPNLKYTISSMTSIEYAPMFFFGDSLTEFGQMPFGEVHYVTFRGVW